MLLVAGWAREIGLEPAVDPHGNLWCLPPGEDPIVTSGSHVDTVPDGGRLDGALGTVLAVEAAGRVSGGRGLLVCAAEEAARFGAGTLGFRSMTGRLTDADLRDMRDAEGRDAQHIAGAVPVALLFVASENGASHAPGESADRRDVEAALAVLAALAQDLQGDGT